MPYQLTWPRQNNGINSGVTFTQKGKSMLLETTRPIENFHNTRIFFRPAATVWVQPSNGPDNG